MSPDAPLPALLDGVTEAEHLKDALDVAEADLRLHVAMLSRLQDDLAASRLEVAGAREAEVNLGGYLVHAQSEVDSAHAHIAELRGLAARREAELVATLEQTRAELAALRAGTAALMASSSWRLTAPVRSGARLLRRGRRRLGRGGAGGSDAVEPVTPAAPPPPPPDPNAAYLFKPARFEPAAGTGWVSVEELYALSRSP